MVKWKNGLVDQYEVPSKTDSLANLMNRIMKNQDSLGENVGTINIIELVIEKKQKLYST